MPAGASSFPHAMEIGCEVFHNLKAVIKAKFGGDATLIGDEGGFAPPCDVESGLAMLMEAIEKAGHTSKCTVGLDVAASEFKVPDKNFYDLDFKSAEGEKDASLMISGDDLLAFYSKISSDYPIVTIEDPFDQDDWANWSKITAALGEKIQIVGDDLTVTNPDKIAEAIEKKACNCLLLKVNQIGSITESIRAVQDSKRAGWGVMTSHRSGETEDDYIADLAVGLCTGARPRRVYSCLRGASASLRHLRVSGRGAAATAEAPRLRPEPRRVSTASSAFPAAAATRLRGISAAPAAPPPRLVSAVLWSRRRRDSSQRNLRPRHRRDASPRNLRPRRPSVARVSVRAGEIKTGAPCRGERTSKYNQLLRIDESLGNGTYVGPGFRTPNWMA